GTDQLSGWTSAPDVAKGHAPASGPAGASQCPAGSWNQFQADRPDRSGRAGGREGADSADQRRSHRRTRKGSRGFSRKLRRAQSSRLSNHAGGLMSAEALPRRSEPATRPPSLRVRDTFLLAPSFEQHLPPARVAG